MQQKMITDFRIAGPCGIILPCPAWAKPQWASLRSLPKSLRRYKFFSHLSLDVDIVNGRRRFRFEQWVLTEYSTGQRVGLGETRAQASRDALERMRWYGAREFIAMAKRKQIHTK